MSGLMQFFSMIGMIVVCMGIISLFVWILIKIEDHKRGIRKPKFPDTVEVPKAPVLGTQIRRPGNVGEVDYSGSFKDWP